MAPKPTHLFLKAVLVLILFFALGNQPIDAQILIGPKAGARLSWVSFNEDSDKETLEAKPVFGYSAGFMVSFKVRERFYLQTDFSYTRKGKRITSEKDPQLENEMINHYFNIPIIYRVDFKGAMGGMDFKYFIGVGPNVNFWLKGNGTFKSSELDENDIEELNYDVDFDYDPELPEEDRLYVKNPNRVQLGLMFSTGMVFEPYGTQTILVELRYEWGHSFMAKENEARFAGVLAYSDPMRVRNQGLQLSVAYLLDTKIAERKKGKSTYK